MIIIVIQKGKTINSCADGAILTRRIQCINKYDCFLDEAAPKVFLLLEQFWLYTRNSHFGVYGKNS
jgi:hypothetical protein